MKLFVHTDSLPAPRPAGLPRFYQTVGMLVKRFPSIRRSAEHEPFAFDFAKPNNRALAIGHFAAVVPVVKLRKVKRQMLFADMMERADYAALEQGEKPFNAVGCNQFVALALDVLSPHVLDGIVIESSAHAAIAIMVVRVHIRTGGNILVDDCPQALASDAAQNLTTNLTAALQHGNDGRFIIRQPFAANLAFHFPADVGFVHLNRAGKFLAKRRVFQGVTYPVRHKKCRAVAAKFQEPLQLERTDAFLGTANQIPSDEPLAERNMAVLENRADSDGELLFATGAPAQSGADFLFGIGRDGGKHGLVGALAMRANHAAFPANAFKVFAGGFVSRELVNDLNQCQVFGLFRFHGSNIAQSQLFVKCIIPGFPSNLFVSSPFHQRISLGKSFSGVGKSFS